MTMKNPRKCYYESSTIFLVIFEHKNGTRFILESLPNKRVSTEKFSSHEIGNGVKRIWIMNSWSQWTPDAILRVGKISKILERIFVDVENSPFFPLGSTYCHQKFIIRKSFSFISLASFIVLSRMRKIEDLIAYAFSFFFTSTHCTIIWTNFLRTQHDVKFYVLDNYPSGNDRNKI